MHDLVTREKALLLGALLCYLAGALQGVAFLFGARRPSRVPLVASIILGLAFQAAFGAARWASQGAIPLGSSRAESLLLLAGAVALSSLIAHATGRAQAAPAFSMPVVVVLFGGVFLSLDLPIEEPFHDPWISAHIAAAMLGYGAFVTAFAFALMHVLQVRQLRARRLSGLARRLPPIETLERSLVGSLMLGLPLLTASLVLGAVLAAGRIELAAWALDPKVLVSLVTWAYYASVLVARLRGRISGARLSQLAIAGFSVLVVTYIATAVVTAGAHPFR